MRNVAIATMLLTAGVAPAAGQQSIQRSYQAHSPMSLTVENRYGPLRVSGGARNEVMIRGTLAGGDSLVVVEAKRHIEIRVVRSREDAGRTSLEVRLPPGNAVDAMTLDGPLHISGTGGVVHLRSGSGEILIDGAVRTVSAETLSGAIVSRAPAQGLVLGTASGDIEVDGARGFLEISTVGGRVDLKRTSVAQATITTVDGPVRFEGSIQPHAVARIDTYSGDVELRLAPTIDAAFTISTFAGTIRNELGPAARSASRYAPGKKLSFSLGTGAGQLIVDTFAGSVSLAGARR